MGAPEQGVDHRVLEVVPPPPGDEGVGVAAPSLGPQERRGDVAQTALHIHDRAVMVEHAELDARFQRVDVGHHRPPLRPVTMLAEAWRGVEPGLAATVTIWIAFACAGADLWRAQQE